MDATRVRRQDSGGGTAISASGRFPPEAGGVLERADHFGDGLAREPDLDADGGGDHEAVIGVLASERGQVKHVAVSAREAETGKAVPYPPGHFDAAALTADHAECARHGAVNADRETVAEEGVRPA